MKDVNAVFDESFGIISEYVKSNNYRGAFMVSNNLTMYSLLSDFEDGVFIGEVLEGIFSQIGPLFERYQISETEQSMISKEIQTLNDKLRRVFKIKSNEELFSTLKSMRSIATKFQIRCIQSAKIREEKGEM